MTQEIRDAVARAIAWADERASNYERLAVVWRTNPPHPQTEATEDFTANAAHLRTLVTTLSACEPTPEMVEAAARELAQANAYDPDEPAPRRVICGPNNEPRVWWHAFEEDARAAVSAALKMVGK